MTLAENPTRTGTDALVSSFGVVDATGVYGWLEAGPVLRYGRFPTTLRAAVEIACGLGLSQLWVHPSAHLRMGLPERLRDDNRQLPPDVSVSHRFTDGAEAAGWRVNTPGGGLRPSFTAVRTGRGHVELFFPGWDRATSPWAKCRTTDELLSELGRFVRATGMLWHRSGAITSEAWLRAHYARSRVIRPTSPPPGDVPWQLVEDDASGVRPELSEDEVKARYCHAFDVNAMYLGAASSLALPVGEPVAVARGRGMAAAVTSSCPGYWRLGPSWWVTSPTLRYLLETGAFTSAGVREGWQYPDHHRFLEPWYRTLREARSMLLARPGPSLEAVKAVYREGVGRFGSERRSRPGDPMHQPYWRSAVIAEARTRLQRRLKKLTGEPIGTDVDAVWFLTNTPGAEGFARKIGLPLGDGLGEFHHLGTCRGVEARAVLGARDPIDALRGLVTR